MRMKRVARLFAWLLAAVASGHVGAHAFLEHASPAVGSAIHGSPPQVSLWFSQELEPAFSSARILDRDGKQVDKQDQRVDRANRALLQVSLPQLPPGRYRVVWRVLSVDTHVTEGDFVFDVTP
jgi:methionine-rich copper-binding protein CopC